MSAPDYVRREMERRSRERAIAAGKIRSCRVFSGFSTHTDETSTTVEVHERDCPCLGCAQWHADGGRS